MLIFNVKEYDKKTYSGPKVSLFGAKYPDKKLRGIITSGALTIDHGKLI